MYPESVDAVIIPKAVPRKLAAVAKKQLKARDALESTVAIYFSKVSKHFHLDSRPIFPSLESHEVVSPSSFLVTDSNNTSAASLTAHSVTIPPSQNAQSHQKHLEDLDWMRIKKYRGTHKAGGIFGKKRDSIKQYSQEFRELEGKGIKFREELGLSPDKADEGDLVGTAFVVFREAYMAHFAAKLVATEAPVVMAERTAHIYPEDVVWQNIDIDYFTRQGRGFITKVVMFCMIVFWGSLVASVLSLADLNNLGQHIPAFQTLLDNYPTVSKAIGGVLPSVIVAVLLSLVPPILRLLSVFGGSALNTQTDSDIYSQYYGFQLCNVFAVNVIGSSILASFTDIENNPSSVMTILAVAIPKSANFFMQYLLVQGLTTPSGEILRLVPLLISPILSFLFSSTPRSIFQSRQPPVWNYSTAMAVHGLAVAIGLVYCVIAPVILVFVTLYFGLYAFVYSYMMQNVYIIKKECETGGRYLFTAANHLFVGLFVMEFMVLALFILAQNIVISVLTLTLVLLTFWAFRHSQKFLQVIDMIPIKNLMDSESNIVGASYFSSSSGLYSWIKVLFPGLVSVGEYDWLNTSREDAAVTAPLRPEENWSELYKAYSDPACGFKDVKVWIPKCSVLEVQSDVVDEICGKKSVGGIPESENVVLKEDRVDTFGSGITETGKIVLVDGFYDVMIVL
ncbi:UNVERIFIED_CONTAM: hypothetical protein HDU68_000662 [Siphonaria sp. JEL0065]|nr:hypothetical protein HDU68_000662 [Siphonaria sp. JEL0065]